MMRTPWGIADDSNAVTRGVTFYHTPSHGGYRVTPARAASYHPALHGQPYGGAVWYEEDCEYTLLYLADPEVGESARMQAAAFVARDPDTARRHGLEAATLTPEAWRAYTIKSATLYYADRLLSAGITPDPEMLKRFEEYRASRERG